MRLFACACEYANYAVNTLRIRTAHSASPACPVSASARIQRYICSYTLRIRTFCPVTCVHQPSQPCLPIQPSIPRQFVYAANTHILRAECVRWTNRNAYLYKCIHEYTRIRTNTYEKNTHKNTCNCGVNVFARSGKYTRTNTYWQVYRCTQPRPGYVGRAGWVSGAGWVGQKG